MHAISWHSGTACNRFLVVPSSLFRDSFYVVAMTIFSLFSRICRQFCFLGNVRYPV